MKRIQGRPSQYPWEKWLNRKKPFTIQETDYQCSQRSMCVMIRNQARIRRVKVGVWKLDQGAIKIIPKGEVS